MNLTWEAVATIATIVGIIITIGGIAAKWIVSIIKNESDARSQSHSAIMISQTDIKTEIKTIHDAFDKRVDRLEQGARDFRSGTSIDAAIDHSRRNTMMSVDQVKQIAERAQSGLETLRDRVTIVETKHEATSIAVNEVKRELKDTRHEINERFDQMAKTQQGQFDQICASIREISDRKPKA